MTYFIIEHPTKGVLQEDFDPETLKPRFSTTKLRSDEENARYKSLRRAILDAAELGLPDGCVVRRKPTDEEAARFLTWPISWPPEKRQ